MVGTATEFGKTDLGVCACMSALAFALVDGCRRGCDNPVPRSHRRHRTRKERPPSPKRYREACRSPLSHLYFGKRNGVFNSSPRVNCQEQRRCALQRQEYSSTLRLRSAKCRCRAGRRRYSRRPKSIRPGLPLQTAPRPEFASSAARSRATDEGIAHHVFQARTSTQGLLLPPARAVMH